MDFKHRLSFLALILIALPFGAREAKACSCAGRPPVLDQFEWANVVVVVQFVSVEKSESERSSERIQSARMIVEKVFKGNLKSGEEMIFAQGGMCGWTFAERDIGQRFLFYLAQHEKEQRLWSAGICGRSRNVQQAADDLLYLEKMVKVRGKTRLSGTLSFYQASALDGEEPVRNYLTGTKLRVFGANKTYELLTNQSGVYETYDLPPGKYVVEPEIPDGWKIDHRYASTESRDASESDKDPLEKPRFEIVLGAGRHAYIDFDYGVNNAIRGKVYDTAGNGMKGVCLSLVPARGKESRYFYKAGCTNKEGAFEIAGIPPGGYVIAVNKNGKISSSEPFPTFYYPNVFEREKAVVITLGPGHMLEGIDVFVPRMEETITVEGVLLHSDGKPVIEESVQFEPEKASDGIDGKARTKTDSTGRFAIKILKGLKGSLYGELFTYPGEYENCPKLEELIRKGGRSSATIRTNAVELRAEDNIANVGLKYSFPDCKKAK